MSKESGGNQPPESETRKLYDNLTLLSEAYQVFWDQSTEKGKELQTKTEKSKEFLKFVGELNPRYRDFLKDRLEKKLVGVSVREQEVILETYEKNLEFFRNNYLLPLTDPEAVEALQFIQKDSLEVAAKKVAAWRKVAKEQFDYQEDDQPIIHLGRAGFTLKESAPQVQNQWDHPDIQKERGLCHKDFANLQNENFPDEPTTDEIRYFIPRIVPNSTDSNFREQAGQVAQIQQALHQHYPECSAITLSIGEANKIANHILAHYNRTGERIPLNSGWVRTLTGHADGGRLGLYWHGGRLHCGLWYWGDGSDSDLAVAPLGVEALGD